jgi:hypothetical protein
MKGQSVYSESECNDNPDFSTRQQGQHRQSYQAPDFHVEKLILITQGGSPGNPDSGTGVQTEFPPG